MTRKFDVDAVAAALRTAQPDRGTATIGAQQVWNMSVRGVATLLPSPEVEAFMRACGMREQVIDVLLGDLKRSARRRPRGNS